MIDIATPLNFDVDADLLYFASDIQPGERILTDHPLVKLPAESNRTLVGQELLRRLELLPESDNSEYFTLSTHPAKLLPGSRMTEQAVALNIFESNAVRAGNDSAVYKNACRINHSCLPNANYCELLVSFLPSFLPSFLLSTRVRAHTDLIFCSNSSHHCLP